MSIGILALSFAVFGVLFILQVVASRLYRPQSEDRFIIILYFFIPLLFYIPGSYFLLSPQFGLTEIVLSYFLYFAISAAWIASYPAIYAGCPTLIISYVIHRSNNGVGLDALINLLKLKENSKQRIDDAVHNLWIKKTEEKVSIAPVGQVFLFLFKTYRTLLGLTSETL